MASTKSDPGDPRAAATSGFLLLHPRDNILICTRNAQAGGSVEIDGERHVLNHDVALGHKIARVALNAGEPVLRYGVAIGTMTASARPGEHIHSHNLKSDYISAHGRDAVRDKEILS
jgi:hypothetical protein